MADIALIRIDFRLIHGQVVARWLKETQATKIIIVNDTLSKDPTMGNIYRMATPAGVRCAIVSVDHFVDSWKTTHLGEGTAMVLFKNVKTVFDAYQKGFNPIDLQIGGLGAGPGRKIVYQNITLNKEDFDMLEKISPNINIYFQATPEDNKKFYLSINQTITF
ncbi:PTS sugar transporter subunit IIB [Pectinatus haikarae]|uniref:PTS sugar transporter subunit IIB n=1 Tax=Pectinatus haikarae TaxID=349096 RepID=UPI0018C52B72|nr:PTS sugar transporter subunit IIB [Pectinatus haikarae]